MPVPSALPTTLIVGSTGHVGHSNIVHTVVNTIFTVPTTGNGAADTAAIQAAITANPGHKIWVSGDVTLSSTLTISTDRTSLAGDGTFTAGFTSAPMVLVQNAAYNEVTGIFFDGNWQGGVAALELRGALMGAFHVHGDRLPIGINLDCNNAAATQNSALNELWVTIRNGVAGVIFKGKSGQQASNNRIRLMDWWGAGSVVSTGIDFAQYADNNYIDKSYLHLNFAGSNGMIFNSATPGSDMQVYENHGDVMIEANVTGTVAIKGNMTQPAIGQWSTFIRLRSSGSFTPVLSVAVNSDIVLTNSNLNGASAIRIQELALATGVGRFVGSGSPESVVTASPGSLYQRVGGGASTSLYVKETGVAATGWRAV